MLQLGGVGRYLLLGGVGRYLLLGGVQQVINQAIPLLNHSINSINTDINCVSPWLGATLHSIIHHKPSHKFKRLRDGLHPTEEMTQIWSDCFVEAILKNYSWID